MTKKPEGQGSFKARKKLRNVLYAAIKTGGTLEAVAEANNMTVVQVKRQLCYLKSVKKYGSGRNKKRSKRGSYKPRTSHPKAVTLANGKRFIPIKEVGNSSFDLLVRLDNADAMVKLIKYAQHLGVRGIEIK